MVAAIVSRLRAASRAEVGMLLGFLLAASLALVFLKLASETIEGETLALDRLILRGLRTSADSAVPIGPAWLKFVMIDVTAIGGATGLTLIALVVIGFLIVAHKYATSAFVATSVLGGALLGNLLKSFFMRPRPDLVAHLVYVDTSSFPSGHAMNSAVVFLTLGSLLARTQERRALRIYLISVAILLTLVVGFSRVYLGVHWPSDVLAGWCIGAAWATLCGIVARRLQIRHRIEQPDPDPDSSA